MVVKDVIIWRETTLTSPCGLGSQRKYFGAKLQCKLVVKDLRHSDVKIPLPSTIDGCVIALQ